MGNLNKIRQKLPEYHIFENVLIGNEYQYKEQRQKSNLCRRN